MAAKPILVIQMQRLGDLVLTYPLLERLSGLFPGHPLWVVGEEQFYRDLTDLTPDAVYFPYASAGDLRRERFRLVVNLSHRPEALDLAGFLDAEQLVGGYRSSRAGAAFVNGDWQLYRASLVHNNRYNLFHWADLNLLDVVPAKLLHETVWPSRRDRQPTSSAHIGLFLGASQPDKRPEPEFWASLADRLLQAGHRPVFLGGEAERELAARAAALLPGASLNLAGRFRIHELCRFIEQLDLFVTPDTGPMHIASWIGTPILNISTGPVNAWETGPSSPGHHVLRSALPCVGCWQCVQSSVLCKEHLDPRSAAQLVHRLVTAGITDEVCLPDQELLATERDKHNLYSLRTLVGGDQPRQVTARFWQAFFGHTFGVFGQDELRDAWRAFAEASPGNVPAFGKSLAKLGRDMGSHFRKERTSAVLDADFWAAFPLPLRPLTSYLHLRLANGMFTRQAFAEALALVERLIALPS